MVAEQPTGRGGESGGGGEENRLRDFLVTLATDPAALGQFVKDPDASMEAAGLSPEDRAVLRSANPSAIHARLAGAATGASPVTVLVVDMQAGAEGGEGQPQIRGAGFGGLLPQIVQPILPQQVIHPISPQLVIHPISPQQVVHPILPQLVIHPISPQQVVHPQILPQQVIHPQILPQIHPQILPQQVIHPQILPQLVLPQLVQPQLVQPQLVQPQLVQPQLVLPQLVLPQLVQPQLVQPQLVISPFGGQGG